MCTAQHPFLDLDACCWGRFDINWGLFILYIVFYFWAGRWDDPRHSIPISMRPALSRFSIRSLCARDLTIRRTTKTVACVCVLSNRTRNTNFVKKKNIKFFLLYWLVSCYLFLPLYRHGCTRPFHITTMIYTRCSFFLHFWLERVAEKFAYLTWYFSEKNVGCSFNLRSCDFPVALSSSTQERNLFFSFVCVYTLLPSSVSLLDIKTQHTHTPIWYTAVERERLSTNRSISNTQRRWQRPVLQGRIKLSAQDGNGQKRSRLLPVSGSTSAQHTAEGK